MTIIHDFKSLRDHMDKIIKRDEAREKATPTAPKTQQQVWCHVCGYHRTCPSCQAVSQPGGFQDTSVHAPSAHDPAR